MERDYGRAMKHYLEIGCVSTSYFSRPVPPSTFDDKVCISAIFIFIFIFREAKIPKIDLACEPF